MDFQSQTQRPAVQFLTTAVPPPTAAYIGLNDQLEIQVLNSLANVVITIFVRTLLTDGTIVPSQFTVNAPPSDRSINNFFFNLAEGFLLSAAVYVNAPGAKRGQTFIRLELIRGGTASFQFGEVLCQGYTGGTDILSWPPASLESSVNGRGFIRSIIGTVPAAGAEIAEVVPTNACWRVIAFQATLTTAIAAANREVNLLFDDGATAFAQVSSGFAQAASLTRAYNFAIGQVAGANLNTQSQMPIPSALFLPAAFRIRSATFNLQAADQYGAPHYLVEEWIQQ